MGVCPVFKGASWAVQAGFSLAGSFILPTELDWEEAGSRVWAVSPQATILGGPGADARSWLASGYNLVATEETLVLGGSVSPQPPAGLARSGREHFRQSGAGSGGPMESRQRGKRGSSRRTEIFVSPSLSHGRELAVENVSVKLESSYIAA